MEMGGVMPLTFSGETMNNFELQDSCKEMAEHTYKKAEKLYNKEFARPIFMFDLKGRTAGQACYKSKYGRGGAIRVNMTLLMENTTAYINRTIPHEVAHHLVMQMFDRRSAPHGWEWKKVMTDLGHDPSRCHSFDTTRARTRSRVTIAYHCDCQTFNLTTIRHNKIKKGRTYHCRQCKTDLVIGKLPKKPLPLFEE
jgi:SprT protein